MNTGSAEALMLTHNHKDVHKIKNDPKWAIDWHRGNQLVLKQHLLFTLRTTSRIPSSGVQSGCPIHSHFAIWESHAEHKVLRVPVLAQGVDTKPQSHISAHTQRTWAMQIPGNAYFWFQRLRDILNEGLQCIQRSHSFSWDFISRQTLSKCDIPGIHWCMFRW